MEKLLWIRLPQLKIPLRNSITSLFHLIYVCDTIGSIAEGVLRMNIEKIGEQITSLRKAKGLTQSELGERLGVSFQAVSKWERGEALPDITLLPDLAKVLETTIDFILCSEEKAIEYKGKFSVADMRKGLNCLKYAGEYLGADNLIYRAAIKGINTDLNTDIEKAFSDDYIYEAFLA